MAGGDPLLDLLGMRDVFSNGVTLPRRSAINIVGGSASDNVALGATNIDVSGLAIGSGGVLAATGDLEIGAMNRYDGSVVATYSLPSTPTAGDIVGVAEVTGGTATVTFDGNGNNLADPTNATPGTPGATMTIGQAYAGMFWKYDGSTWLLQSSPVTPVGGGGGGSLEATLAIGNTTGANNIVMSGGQVIKGTDGATGSGTALLGGTGSAGSGGAAGVIAGSGTTSGGEASLIGGNGSAGDGGGVLLQPGTATGGNDGDLTIAMPDGTTYLWPVAGGGAGTVLTDAAGDGVLSWAAGGGGLLHEFTVTVAQNVISVSTSGFPTGSLRIELSGVSTSTADATRITFNTDSSLVYDSSYHAIDTTPTLTGSSSDGANLASIRGLNLRPASEANFQTAIYDIMEWDSTDRFTQVVGRGLSKEGGTIADSKVSAQWRNNAAVTTIEFTAASGNFDVGSTIRVYSVAGGGGGAGTLADTLALGNTSGVNDIVMASGQVIKGTDAATGGDMSAVGGVGSAGAGGSSVTAGGDGTTIGGDAGLVAGSGSSGNAAGGQADVVAGNASGDGTPGNVTALGGNADVNGVGGSVQSDGGEGGSASGAGGFISSQGGQGIAAGAAGGQGRLKGGTSVSGDTGGALMMTEDSTDTTGGNAGPIDVIGGNAGASTDGDGASINITPGSGDGTGVDGVVNIGGVVRLFSVTVGTLPAVIPAGGMVFVTDETGGAVPAFSDGTNWRRVTDRAVVS